MSNFSEGFKSGIKNIGLNSKGLGEALGNNVGGLGTAIGGTLGGLVSNGLNSGAGEVINTLGDIGGMIPGPWGAAIGGGLKVIAGGVNALVGSKVDQEKLNAANAGTNYLNNFTSNASTFDNIQGPEAQAAIQDPYTGGLFVKKSARRKNNALREARVAAQSYADRSVENNINNIANTQTSNMLSNYAAFGGELNTQGADFTNGLLHINNGGTHESNPYEGVPMGIDQNGTPNLVEEGETVFKDYVFSNRLHVPKSIRSKYKLKGTKKLTFAEASKKLSKESEERPNDPISQRGLEAAMMDLIMEQEKLREKRPQQQVNKFSTGGWNLEQYESYQNDPSTNNNQNLTNNNQNLTTDQLEDLLSVRDTNLRYAPAIGLGLATLTDTLGWTNKPSYNHANTIVDLGKNIVAPKPIEWNPLGDYLNYKPLDRNYYLNQLAASSGATRRNILNTSGGNRGQAIAGLLAADYNTGIQLGNLARQAEEYNLAQRQQVGEFNRGTNQINSEGFLKAAKANQDAYMKLLGLGLETQMKGYQMREAAKLASDEAKAANLSGLIESLGAIGMDNAALNARDFRLAANVDGPINPSVLKFYLNKRRRSRKRKTD